MRAPEAESIGKGKAWTRYESGIKTSIAVANARTAGGRFIAGTQALPMTDTPPLGQIEQVKRRTGVSVEQAYLDAAKRDPSMRRLARRGRP